MCLGFLKQESDKLNIILTFYLLFYEIEVLVLDFFKISEVYPCCHVTESRYTC